MIGDWFEVFEYVGEFLPAWEQDLIDSVPASPSPASMLSVATQAATWQRWDQSFPIFEPAQGYAIGDIVELARAVIPWGMIGRITRIDTAVIDATTGSTGDPSNPFQWANRFEFFLVANMEYDASIRARGYVAGFGSLYYHAAGGVPLARFGRWDDNRFLWGSSSNEIDQPIPAGSIVRLFARAVDDIPFQHRLKGRLCFAYAAETSIESIMRVQR